MLMGTSLFRSLPKFGLWIGWEVLRRLRSALHIQVPHNLRRSYIKLGAFDVSPNCDRRRDVEQWSNDANPLKPDKGKAMYAYHSEIIYVRR